jgi:hypothetical protein
MGSFHRLAHTLAVIALIASLAVPAAAVPSPPPIDDTLLPFCWGIRSTVEGSPREVSTLAAKTGAAVESIVNYKVNAAGIPLQVNVVTCASAADADTLYRFFTKSGLPPGRFAAAGERVYEFISQNPGVAAKMKDLLGLGGRGVKVWRVEMEVVPLVRGDDSRWNDFFNALSANRRDPEDEDAVMRVIDLSADFRFADSLRVRMEHPSWGAPTYSFSPQGTIDGELRDILTVAFTGLPRRVDVPRVEVFATVPTRSFAAYEPAAAPDKYSLLRATDPWPVAHVAVRNALAECYQRDWPQRRNVESILCWVYHNIDYGGDQVGSRYGTLEVLEQRYGHCWDKTDVFISMCRMIDVPARQVYGWIAGQSGHVWAEVYLEDEGWVSVDPTCSWLGVTDDYIPLFISEDGHPPFVYADIPRIIEASD